MHIYEMNIYFASHFNPLIYVMDYVLRLKFRRPLCFTLSCAFQNYDSIMYDINSIQINSFNNNVN